MQILVCVALGLGSGSLLVLHGISVDILDVQEVFPLVCGLEKTLVAIVLRMQVGLRVLVQIV
jgi:hypothetical protein